MIRAQLTAKHSKSNLSIGIHVFASEQAMHSFCGDRYTASVVKNDTKHWVNDTCLKSMYEYNVRAYEESLLKH
jgi:hypothetical protein